MSSPAPVGGLLLYDGFERSDLRARMAAGDPQGEGRETSVSEGKLGRGVEVGNDGFSWRLSGNLNPARGSLAFWVRRMDAGNDGAASVPLLEAPNFLLRFEPKDRRLRFMTGRSVPVEGFKWDYSCQSQSDADFSDWTHVAATWDHASGEKILFVDGEPVSRAKTDLIRSEVNDLKARLTLGGKTPLLFDEVAVWDRVLTPEEIAAVAADAPALARAVDKLPTDPVATRGTVIGLAKRVSDASIVAPGEAFVADVPVTNQTSAAWSGVVKLALLDFDERIVDRGEQPLKLARGATALVRVAFSAKQAGIYKVNATAGTPAATADVISFVVWPEQPPLRDDSFFGVHVNSWSETVLAQSARLGFRWNRNHNMLQTTWWPRVQPEPGEFVWKHDPSLALNEQYGFRVMGQFFGTPYWAAANGPLPPQKVSAGDSAYPYGARPDLEAYRTYVYETVKRYKDRIKIWEVWNEPDVSMFWNGTPEQFAELCKVTYEAAKKADPDCVLVVAGFSSGWRWAQRAAEAGALRYADAVSIHYYHAVGSSPSEILADTRRARDFFRDLIARHGRKPDLPLWQSEGGAQTTTWLRGQYLPGWPPAKVLPPIDARAAAIRQVQVDVILQSLGFVKSFHYLSNPNQDYASLSDLDLGGAPKPAMVARAVLAREVDGWLFQGWIRRPEGGVWAAVYSRPGTNESQLVAWAGEGAEVTFAKDAFGEVAAQDDLMGLAMPVGASLRLTEKPVYLRVKAPAADVIARGRAAALAVERPPTRPEEEARDVTPAGAATLDRPSYAAAAENPASLFTVDLRPFANLGFADKYAGDRQGGWSDEGDLNDLHTMLTGRKTFYAVPFDIIDPAQNGGRAILTLRGKRVTPTLPEAVRGIPVTAGRVRALYFLQAAAWAGKGPLARYAVHYRDGVTVEVPVVVGVNTNDWWSKPDPAEESKTVPVKMTPMGGADTGWRYLRVFEWQNPRPDAEIAAIDFLAGPGEGTPILIAVSGVRW